MSADLKGLEGSRRIYEEAVRTVDPVAVVLAFSGGDDSLTTYHVAKALGVKLDFVLHVNTRTGIRETTEFVRGFADAERVPYVEADAGTAYEDYVTRKGFFGRGERAHAFAYHVLKAQHLRSAISRHIRRRRKNCPVLILNGARVQESDNRRDNLTDRYARPDPGERPNYWVKRLTDKYIRPDPSAPSNHWVNLIHFWSKKECREFLGGCGASRNPVAERLCRSGECMCGTMQSDGARAEAAFWYPAWGRWLDALERRVTEKFPWHWGRDIPKSFSLEQAGQQRLPEFQPLCSSCKVNAEDYEPEIRRLM